MKLFVHILLLSLSFSFTSAQGPVIVGDCTVIYSISGSDAATNKNLAGATKTVYIKGQMIRLDLNSQAYKQTIINDNRSGTIVVLKEIGDEKYKSSLNADDWKKENKAFEGISFSFSNESKTILGYQCKKAVGHLKDGTSYNVWYATAIKPSASENPYQFKDIPGFVLEYETLGTNTSSRIVYTAIEINFNPVPANRFEIPATGYRILK